MRPLLTCGLLFLFVYGCVAPPVTEQKKKQKHDKESAENNEIEEQAFDVEYKRYLQEVVNILEKDEDFKTRLEKADPDDIKSGKIAKDIEFVNHNVRSKLDELKRQELERLRQAAMRQYEHDNGIDRKHMKIPAHLDPNNPHTFEAEDLRKLIVQTTKDLEEADRQRKDEFKEYEMRKELEYQEQLKKLDEKNRADAERQHQELMKKHQQHKPLHHPGSKPQLEEVWEEQDHLSPEDFNPKTFFHLHDLDGNGYWDANEVKALFRKELDKMYDPNAPEDDMKERMEEMERMREHVFNETDQNKDQLISFQEFLDQTKKQEFERDEGWEPLDQHQQYSPEEYQQYARQHEEEIRRMIDQGLIPPAPPGYVPVILPPGAQLPPGAHHIPIQGTHPQDQHHMPPPGMHPNAGLHPNAAGMHPNAAGLHPGQQGYHPQDAQQIQHLQAQQQAYQQQLAQAQHQAQMQYHHQQQQQQQVPQQHQQQQLNYQQHQQPPHQQQQQLNYQPQHHEQQQLHVPQQQQQQQQPQHQQQQFNSPPASPPIVNHADPQQQQHYQPVGGSAPAAGAPPPSPSASAPSSLGQAPPQQPPQQQHPPQGAVPVPPSPVHQQQQIQSNTIPHH